MLAVTLRYADSAVRSSAFRGWQELELRPGRHALVVGEPRAGRSDLMRPFGGYLARTRHGHLLTVPRGPACTEGGTDGGEVCTDGGGTGGGDVPDARDDATEAAPDIRRAEVEVVLADLGEDTWNSTSSVGSNYGTETTTRWWSSRQPSN